VVDREGGTLIVSTMGDIDDEHRNKERQLRISRIEASEKRLVFHINLIYIFANFTADIDYCLKLSLTYVRSPESEKYMKV
jgi:hypothetical protein